MVAAPGDWLWDLILDEETHSSEAMAGRLRSASGFAVALSVIDRLQGAFPEHWCAFLRRALPLAQKGSGGGCALTVPILADLWLRGATRDQVERYLAREVGCSPGWLARWLIALRIHSLSQVRPDPQSIAHDTGFARLTDLEAFLVRFAGRKRQELTTDFLLEILLARCPAASVDQAKEGFCGGAAERTQDDSPKNAP